MPQNRPANALQLLALGAKVVARFKGIEEAMLLRRLSRALGRSDRMMSKTLERMEDRTGRPHKPRARSPVSQQSLVGALAWLVRTEERTAQAEKRYRELMSAAVPAWSGIDAAELMVSFHVLASGLPRVEFDRLARHLLAFVANEEPGSNRLPVARRLVQHLINDDVSLTFDLVQALCRPAVRKAYEPADFAFNVANAIEKIRLPAERDLTIVTSVLKTIKKASLEAYALSAFLLVARLGSLPGLLESAWNIYLPLLRKDADLRAIPRTPLMDYASRFDYGQDLAKVLQSPADGPDVDVLLICERVVGEVGGGERRRKGAVVPRDERERTAARFLARRFNAWAIGHYACKVFNPGDTQGAVGEIAGQITGALSSPDLAADLDAALVNELFAEV